MARRAKARCKGTAVKDGACTKCFRDVRVTKAGVAYSHFPKAPVARTDPRHAAYLLKTYGITGEQYEALLEAQDGKCFICEKPPRSKRLAVDHDHTKEMGEPGYIRGLLCRRCNHRLLGSANDATRILERAILYLSDPPARKVLGNGETTNCAGP